MASNMSFLSGFSEGTSGQTFYEGELQMKTGAFTKTKIFASILKNDASFYYIDYKNAPRGSDGKIRDRVDPYYDEFASPLDLRMFN